MTASATDTHKDLISHHDKVLIVDFGSQVTQLIARRVREAGVYCEIAPFQSAEKAFADLRPKAVILSKRVTTANSAAPNSKSLKAVRCSMASGKSARNMSCG